jgi:hypothetical protein
MQIVGERWICGKSNFAVKLFVHFRYLPYICTPLQKG